MQKRQKNIVRDAHTKLVTKYPKGRSKSDSQQLQNIQKRDI